MIANFVPNVTQNEIFMTANFVPNVTQFEEGESEGECVAFCSAQLKLMSPPWAQNQHTSEDVDQLADQMYTQVTGGTTEPVPISVEEFKGLLTQYQLTFEEIGTDIPSIDAALNAGCPVVIQGAESGFLDIENNSPYPWDTTGIDHAIVAIRSAYSGTSYTVVDSANPQPIFPVYQKTPMQLFSAIKIIPYWKHVEKAAQDTWNSTAFLFGGSPLPYTTSIAASWQDLYIHQQRLMPPPTTREFDSVDCNGNPITVQFFGILRCEWSKTTHTPLWFKADGGM